VGNDYYTLNDDEDSDSDNEIQPSATTPTIEEMPDEPTLAIRHLPPDDHQKENQVLDSPADEQQEKETEEEDIYYSDNDAGSEFNPEEEDETELRITVRKSERLQGRCTRHFPHFDNKILLTSRSQETPKKL
jgi:hypothetical protein